MYSKDRGYEGGRKKSEESSLTLSITTSSGKNLSGRLFPTCRCFFTQVHPLSLATFCNANTDWHACHVHADAAGEASPAQVLARSQRRCLVCSFQLLVCSFQLLQACPIPTGERVPAPSEAQREFTLVGEYFVSNPPSGQ